ncbi:MAG: adenine phosphoribosyltransferase [Chloroflexi bacterium]|nr:adenine phosphoribosyltransferase [Chloroflexota bacterium]|tara:strand:- start:6644 stop:7156 length:513 start_codon:yes stop_codon:yes gene_type:complete
MDLSQFIREIPDFPESGILFKDITPLIGNAQAFKTSIEMMADLCSDIKIDHVLAIEARGYIFGSPLATKLNAGFIPVRKSGKLPYSTIKMEYGLEYGKDVMEMHADALKPGENVLIVDDVLATGGTLEAAAKLVEQTNAIVAGMLLLLEIEFLNGRSKLEGYRINTLMKC